MMPMIDVLLVVIIIFMVIAPMAPKGLTTLVPQQPTYPPESVRARELEYQHIVRVMDIARGAGWASA